MSNIIPGGYYIKARRIQESEIQRKPPVVRETWDWLLMNANHRDRKYNGFIVKRGQLFRTYKEILDGLSWQIGYRKMTYSDAQMKHSMKALRELLMITTKKELGGVLITVLNYDRYQDPKNYERTNESTNDLPNDSTNDLPNDSTDNNKKERKKERKKKTLTEKFLEYAVKKSEELKYSESCNLKISEFIKYRMAKSKSARYESEKGIDELFRNLVECDNRNYDLLKCLDIAMGRGWKIPAPNYFENDPPMAVFQGEQDNKRKLEEVMS